MKRHLGWRTVLMLGLLAAKPVGAWANCVPSVPTGWIVPFSISTMNKANAVATYTSGELFSSINGTTAILSNEDNNQLFSDRIGSCSNGDNLCEQPFDVNEADRLGVQITSKGSAVTVTLTLESWGNGTISFAGHCDTLTNLLYGSATWPPNSKNAMFLINFGTPEDDIPK
jgi:hypothetical protein